jgi:uncharacterized spore protein YtfJ
MDLQELMNKVTQNLSANRAFGPAYEKDGVMLIPVALVAGGGGGGEGPMVPTSGVNQDEESDATEPESKGLATGSGGGFGGVVVPVGAYVVKDEQVRWVPAVNSTVVVLAALVLVRMLLRARARASRRRRD